MLSTRRVAVTVTSSSAPARVASSDAAGVAADSGGSARAAEAATTAANVPALTTSLDMFICPPEFELPAYRECAVVLVRTIPPSKYLNPSSPMPGQGPHGRSVDCRSAAGRGAREPTAELLRAGWR